MFQFREYRFKYYSIRLVIYIIAITTIGIAVIGSASDYGYDKTQLRGLIAGLFLMAFISIIDYHFILKLYWLIYIANLILLLMVRFMGDDGGGAQRWLDLGFIQIQPSELAKIMIILFFAKFLEVHKENLNTGKILISSIILFVLPFALVFIQPDLSTSIVLISVFCTLIFVAGLSYKIIGSILGVGIPAFGIILYNILQPDQTLLSNYQRNRILGFLYQDSNDSVITAINYQQKNSVLAIGSGQLMGKGLNNNTIASVKNANFISEPQTDFIFSIVGEELGFIGAATVVLLLFLIAIECIWIGRSSKDLSGRLICCGMAAIVGFQSFINMGVATWILPNTGLPLPFVSYGMSSLMSLLIGMGVVLNVGIQRQLSFKETLYDDDY